MPKYIDADVLLEQMKLRRFFVGRSSDPICIIEDAPAAHVAEVVYCSECVYHYDDGDHKCKKLRIPCPDDSEFFCKYGKRKG